MRYPTATAFRRALEDRLNRRARMTGEATMRLRKNVVFQRLLARLLAISPGRWILKGGLALDLRLSDRGARPRATKDIDMARRGYLPRLTPPPNALRTSILEIISNSWSRGLSSPVGQGGRWRRTPLPSLGDARRTGL